MCFILVHDDCSVWFEFKPIRARNRSHLPAVCSYSVCMTVSMCVCVCVCVCVYKALQCFASTQPLWSSHTNTPRSHLPLSALAVIICQRWQPPLFNRRRSACHSSRRVPNHPRAGNLCLCWCWLISSVLSTPPSWLSHPANIRDWLLLSCYRRRSGEIDTCSPDKGSPDVEGGGSPVRLQRRRCLLKHAWWPAWNVDDE